MNLSGKNIIITSGGTREYIDDVRVLTNISSGKLGSMIADECIKQEANVHYVYGKGAVLPDWFGSGSNLSMRRISTLQDLIDHLDQVHKNFVACGDKVDAVIMAIAASDFTFKRDGSVKLKSNDPEAFVEYMRKTITPNPKVITKIKDWWPDTFLVGFKFEVGLEHTDLIKTARTAMVKTRADLTVANDKVEMNNANSHVGYLVTQESEEYCASKAAIVEQLVGRLVINLNREPK